VANDIFGLQDSDGSPPSASSSLHHAFSHDSDHEQDWLDVCMDSSPSSELSYDSALLSTLHGGKALHDLDTHIQDLQGDHHFVDLTMEEYSVSQAPHFSPRAPSPISEGHPDRGPPDVPRFRSAEHLTSGLEFDDYLISVDDDNSIAPICWTDPFDPLGKTGPWSAFRDTSPDELFADIDDTFDLYGSVLEI